MFRPYERKILLRIILLPLSFALLFWLYIQGHLLLSILLMPFILYQLYNIFNYQRRVYAELEQFTEAIQYRDFSRRFNEKNTAIELRALHSAFNKLSYSFKQAAKEKETQYHYLQKIVEVVETGILFLAEDTGEVILMNESLQKMLSLPYLKKIDSLKKRNENLYQEIMTITPNQPGLITVRTQEDSAKVLLSVSHFQIEGMRYRLMSFQNVNEVLDETETKAWQKLLSVLTHEIMNSIAPISSLADTLKTRIQELDKHDDTLEDIELGIDTIKRRSEGLLKFAETYRNLNNIPALELEKVPVRNLFENIQTLMQPMLQQKNIQIEVLLKNTDLTIQADPTLIEQVLINLLVNAIEALKNQDNPKIVLSAYQISTGKTSIKVADNGPGIPENLLDKIFIPFFSTKKTGSGIGLTLSKQIMMLHKGSIKIQAGENKGTAFLLQF